MLWTMRAIGGKISLRRSQLKMVDQGNPAMAIWLGKQYLGQTDEIRHALNVSTQLQIVIPCGVEAQPAGSRLIDAAEDLDAEIEAADYETV